MIKANRIGLIGIVFAILGVCVAALQDDIRVRISSDSPMLEEKVAEKGITLFRKGTVAEEKHDLVDFIYIGLGLVALMLGVVSYITKENHRVSAVAGALGIVAIAWQYVLIGVVIAIVVLFLGSFS